MKTERVKLARRQFKRRLIIIGAVLFAACLSVGTHGQITGVPLEGSSTIGAGRVQFGGIYGLTGSVGGWGSNLFYSSYGVRAGIGVTDHFDLKFTYSRWDYADSYDVGDAYQLTFKISNENERFAFSIPVGYQVIKRKYNNEFISYEDGDIYSITPQLILCAVRTKYFELDFSPYVEILGEAGNMPFYTTGATLGMGFTSNPEIWSLRLEGSMDALTAICGNPSYTVGAGLYFNIGKQKRKPK